LLTEFYKVKAAVYVCKNGRGLFQGEQGSGATVFDNSVTGRGSVIFLEDPVTIDWTAQQRAIRDAA